MPDKPSVVSRNSRQTHNLNNVYSFKQHKAFVNKSDFIFVLFCHVEFFWHRLLHMHVLTKVIQGVSLLGYPSRKI